MNAVYRLLVRAPEFDPQVAERAENKSLIEQTGTAAEGECSNDNDV
jgi:hypothetical protein